MVTLIGATGYLGGYFARFLTKRNISFRTIRGSSLRSKDDILSQLTVSRTDFLINCAGYTGRPNVDACEKHQAECLFANSVLPGLLGEACRELDLPWGHFSSGCIFAGSKTGDDTSANSCGFKETDVPNFSFRQNNCSFYSGTKVLGEETIGYRTVATPEGWVWKVDGPPENAYIWRIRMPFHHIDNTRNYLTKLMRYELLLDARNSISHLDEAIAACWACIEKRVPFGIYHVTNPGSITTREAVELILRSETGRKMAAEGKVFSYFQNEGEFMRKAALAPRSNCILDSSKLASTGIRLTPIHESIEKSLRDWGTIESFCR